jgi:hypothetical protein
MVRFVAFVVFPIALLFAAVGTTRAAEYGTPAEAKALLEKAVAAIKQNKAKALEMFNKAEGGFKDLISMCLAPTLLTALSRRIHTLRENN